MYKVQVIIHRQDSGLVLERKMIELPFAPMTGISLEFKTGKYDTVKIEKVVFAVEDQQFDVTAVYEF